MRRFGRLVTMGMVVVAGCGLPPDRDDDDNTPYALESGLYDETTFVIVSDTCDAQLDPFTEPIDVFVTETTVAIGETVLDRAGNSLSSTEVQSLDFRPDIDCALDFTFDVTGRITADDTFNMDRTISVEVAGGTVCESLFEVSLPCSVRTQSTYVRVDVPTS